MRSESTCDRRALRIRFQMNLFAGSRFAAVLEMHLLVARDIQSKKKTIGTLRNTTKPAFRGVNSRDSY